MKKILIRIIGSVCILVAVLILFLSTCVTVKDVSRKDMRECRNLLTANLERVEGLLLEEISYSKSEVKAELKDYDLPSSKSSIKKRIKKVETIIEDVVDHDISLKEVFAISCNAPQLITDANNLLNTSLCMEIVVKGGDLIEEDVQIIVETITDYKGTIILVSVFIVFLAIVGIAAATTHSLNKVRWLKYIFILLLILIVVGVNIAIPVMNDFIQNELKLEAGFEDMAFHVTAMPYICLVFAIVPVVLDIVFEKKNKIKEEK